MSFHQKIHWGFNQTNSQEIPQGGWFLPSLWFDFGVKCELSQIKAQNQAAKTKYFDRTIHVKDFKAGDRNNPLKFEDGKEIEKIEPHITKQKVILCKSHQNKSYTCQLQCKYVGRQFTIGDCPLCCCRCKFLSQSSTLLKLKLKKWRKQWQLEQHTIQPKSKP